MDETLRDLERRAESDPTLLPVLARAQLRSGTPPAQVLAAVRQGLRAEPASSELHRLRDEALSRFWSEARYEPLLERPGMAGRRVSFSHDGSLLAVAWLGVFVVDVERNQIVGAGYAGRPVRALAFVGRELLLDDDGLALWDPVSGKERARVPGTAPTIAVATSAGSSRGFAVTAKGSVVRFGVEKGKVTAAETVTTLTPPPVAAVGWAGLPGWTDHLLVATDGRVALRSGAALEHELDLSASGPRLLSGLDRIAEALIRFGPGVAYYLADDRTAISPDLRAAILESREAAAPSLHTIEGKSPARLPLPLMVQGYAFSPCGSRLAAVYEDRLIVLQAC
jgi:hypothetical protein